MQRLQGAKKTLFLRAHGVAARLGHVAQFNRQKVAYRCIPPKITAPPPPRARWFGRILKGFTI